MEETGFIHSRPAEKETQRTPAKPPCASQLYGFENHYKIKLRASSYRLVYEIIEKEIVILVISVGRRDKNLVYKKASKRIG